MNDSSKPEKDSKSDRFPLLNQDELALDESASRLASKLSRFEMASPKVKPISQDSTDLPNEVNNSKSTQPAIEQPEAENEAHNQTKSSADTTVKKEEISVENLIDLGAARIEQAKYLEALELFERAVNLSPQITSSFVYWNGRGVALFHLGNYKDAIASLQQAISLKGDSAQVWYLMGKSYEQLGESQMSIYAYTNATKFNPEYTQKVEQLTQQQNNSSEAEQIFQQGLIYERTGAFHEAESCYRQAIALNSNFSACWYHLGLIAQNLGRLPLAISLAKKAYKLNNNWDKNKPTDALYLQAHCNYQLGFATETIFLLKRILKTSTHDKETQAYLSFCTSGEQRRRQAAQLVQGSFERLDDEPIQETKEDEKKRYQDICANFKRAVELTPHISIGWYGYAIALHKIEEYQQSLSAVERAILINSQWWIYGIADGWCYRGINLAKLGRFEEAKTAYQQALLISNNNNPLAHEGYIDLLSQQVFYDDAPPQKQLHSSEQKQEAKIVFQPPTKTERETEIWQEKWLEKLTNNESGIDLIMNIVPELRQLDNGRDLGTSMHNLVFKGQYEERWCWVGLGWNLLALVPQIGELFDSTNKVEFFETFYNSDRILAVESDRHDLTSLEPEAIEKLKNIVSSNWEKEVYKLTSYWKQYLTILKKWLDTMPELLVAREKKQLLETLQHIQSQSETDSKELTLLRDAFNEIRSSICEASNIFTDQDKNLE